MLVLQTVLSDGVKHRRSCAGRAGLTCAARKCVVDLELPKTCGVAEIHEDFAEGDFDVCCPAAGRSDRCW